MSRVLLATFGSLGDLHPYLAVGRALKDRGITARVATSSDYRSNVQAAGLEFAPVAPSLAELGTPQQLARRVADGLRGTQRLIQELIMPHLRESHQQLRAAAEDADLLISHPLTFMLQVVAAEKQKPWLSSVLAPASLLSRHDPPALSPIDSLRIAQRMGPWAYDLLIRAIRTAVRRWEQPLHDYRRELGLAPTGRVMVFEGQFSPRGTLALFDAVLMQPQPDWPPHTHLCGAPLYDGLAPDPQMLMQLQEFLAAGPPPIVFALGSSAIWLGARFWRESLEAARRLKRRAILITGGAGLSGLPASAREFSYLPYSQVFPHACAVVHQAGIGTLAQALRAGRPQLITPVWFDQPDNAARAVKLGVARSLSFKRATASRMVHALLPLLTERTFSAAARDVAQSANAVDGAAAAANYIIEVLERR